MIFTWDAPFVERLTLVFFFSFVFGSAKPVSLESSTTVSLVAAHAALPSLGEDNIPLLVANEHGAGVGDVGED